MYKHVYITKLKDTNILSILILVNSLNINLKL